MRIEGTATFPATAERVFAALVTPATLARAIPGCERLIQLGPTTPDETTTFEVRVRGSDGGVATVALQVTRARRPEYLRVDLHSQGPQGAVAATGRIDLVEQEGRTIGAYVWDVAPRPSDALGAISGEGQAHSTPASVITQEAGQVLAGVICERLAQTLRAETSGESNGASPLPHLHAETAHGQIIELPDERGLGAGDQSRNIWVQRTLWMGTGLLAGLSAIGLVLAAARWFAGRDE